MTFPNGSVYAVCSLLPVTVVPVGWSLLCCYPIDMCLDGTIPDSTRYLSIVRKPDDTEVSDSFLLFHVFDYARPYKTQWLTFTESHEVDNRQIGF